MNARAPAILDHLASLADTTRSRILLLLDRRELTVSELCGILQLPQSTVSRHLKALADSGWIAARAEGTSHLYTMTRDELDASARRDAGSTPVARGARGAAHEIAGVLFLVGRSVGSRARRAVRRPVSSRRFRRLRGSRVGGRRSGLRHRAGDGGARAVCRARDRGRCIRRDAAGGEKAPAGPRQRRPPARRAGSSADRRGAPRRRDADARAALRARAGARARRGGARPQAAWAAHYRRHAAARSRELQAEDGARVARLQRRAPATAADRGRVRRRSGRGASTRRPREGAGAVRRDGKKTNATTKTRRHEKELAFSSSHVTCPVVLAGRNKRCRL